MDLSAREYCLRAVAHLKVEPPPEDDGPAIVLPDSESPVVRRLGHGLTVVYLVDEGDHFTYVQNRRLAEASLTPDELNAKALRNLAAFANQHVKVKPYGAMHVVLAGGNFEASTLLVEEFWSSWYGHLAPNGFVVAFPARDLLAFGDLASPEAEAELRALCERTKGQVDYPLSCELFRRVSNAWEPLGG